MAFGDPDASTPAFVKANTVAKAATTASFTPPAGAVLVAWAWHDTAGGNLTNTSVVTDSQGLTWAIRATRSKQSDGAGAANSHLQISTAVVASSVAMTVTTTGTNCNNPAGLYVGVYTSADTTTPMDVTPVEGTINAAVVSAIITTVTDGARCFLGVIDWNFAAAMTAGSGQTGLVIDTIGSSPDDRIFLGVQNAVTSPAGGTTMSTGSPSTGNTNNYIAIALRPAAAPSGANPDGLAVPVALGGPTATLNLTAAPSGLPVAASLGAPTVAIPSAAPTGIAVPVALGSPTVTLNRSAAPSGIAVQVSLGNPTVAASPTPTGVGVTVSLGVPTVALGRAGAPAGTAAPVAVGTPTAGPMTGVTPTGIAVVVAVGSPVAGDDDHPVVVRPFTGVASRPDTGIVVRPYTGVAVRP